MTQFFYNAPSEAAKQIEALSHLLFNLREDRKLILSNYRVDDEETLLALIEEGKIPEHPGYEHYLSAKTLLETRELIRKQLREVCTTGF